MNKRIYALLVLILGIISVVFQVLLMREAGSAFAGNELTFGLVLSIWLMLSGLGYLAARGFKWRFEGFIKWLFALVAVIPAGTVLVLRVLTNIIFVRGSLVPPTHMFLFLLLVMLPFCFLNGFFIIAISGL